MDNPMKTKAHLENALAEAQKRIAELERHAARCGRATEDSFEDSDNASVYMTLMHEAFNASPIGLAIFDTDMRYVTINRTLADLNGKPAQDHIGRRVRDIIPDLAGEIESVMRRVLHTGQPVLDIFISGSVASQPGITRYWNQHCFPLKDNRGRVIGVSIVVEEITARRRAEEALKESEKKYRTLFDSIDEGFVLADVVFDENGRPVDAYFAETNDAAANMLGQDVTGRYFRDVFSEGRVYLLDVAGQVALTGRNVRMEHFLEPDKKWYSFFLFKIGGPDSRRIGTIFQDITERRRAEEERARLLQDTDEQRGRLQAIIDSLPVGLCITDNTGKIIFMNDIAKGIWIGRAHYAKNIEEFSSDKAWWSDTGERIAAEDMPVARSLRGEICKTLAVDFERSDGTRGTQLVSSAPIRTSDGSITGSIALVQDITEQRRAQRALRESEEKYRSLFESSIDGILLTMPDGRITAANPAACRILQMTEEEIVQAGRDGVVDTSDPRLRLALEERRRKGKARAELIFRRKDGTTFPADISSSVISDQEDHIRSSVVFRDITERKEAEKRIRKLNEELEQRVKERTGDLIETVDRLDKQREVLQTIIDSIPVMLMFYDPAGKIYLVNRELEKVLGWSKEEMQTMDLMAAVYPDSGYRREVREYMIEAEPGWKDLTMTTRSGTRVCSSWSYVRLSDGSQIGIGIDVSERRRIDQDMKRLATAIEQSGEGIVIHNPDWVIVYANPAFEALTGYGREELMGKGISDLAEYFHGNDYGDISEYISRHGKQWSGVQKRKRKSGEVIDISLTVAPVHDQEGRIMNYVSAVRDVTAELRMQNQLAQNQKLEAIGTLAGGIAHDLKNILTPIVINTEVALMDIEEDHPVRELLEEIGQAARMGSDVVSQIVTFSRRSLQEKKPVAIENVVKESVDFLRSALPSTIDIRLQLSAGNARVLADPTRIKQVMVNLGSNAGHAMRENGGNLFIETAQERLNEEKASVVSPDLKAGRYVKIMVRDTGVGMDEQTKRRIFEPFFTTKKQGEGAGMGLSVVHGIVKDHEGAVSVWSKPGKGSVFTVFLPVWRDSGATGDEPSPLSAPGDA
ncbi:MAG: PAS domain S-box protein [Bacteriovoracaceae bacterium]|nr:PAS domain S-box protein [Bacteriovoracaceae bacterium]